MTPGEQPQALFVGNGQYSVSEVPRVMMGRTREVKMKFPGTKFGFLQKRGVSSRGSGHVNPNVRSDFGMAPKYRDHACFY